uniref:Reverse transcriptase domain-containing protein n=1 Tax=Angiostrongylus cantonensis TaxID=6313 RepID=A0A0K0DAS0_ANGCA
MTSYLIVLACMSKSSIEDSDANECLNCSNFGWTGKHYVQMRVLAMGQRLAPTLAVVFMAKVEAPVIDLGPLLYCTYIDYCFVICSTQEEIDKCFDLLNKQSEYIEITREEPKEEWLLFLNVQVNLSENGYGVCVLVFYDRVRG